MSTKILRASKLIFEEAMPVLHGKMQLRLVMPTKAIANDEIIIAKVPTQLSQLPHYARQQIRGVLVVSSTADICSVAGDEVRGFWDDVKTVLPNITFIRLHFDLGNMVREADTHFDNMSAVATLPKLLTVLVEAFAGRFYYNAPTSNVGNRTQAINRLRCKLISTVKTSAEGHNIKVVDGTTKSETQAYEILKPVEQALHKLMRATRWQTPDDDPTSEASQARPSGSGRAYQRRRSQWRWRGLQKRAGGHVLGLRLVLLLAAGEGLGEPSQRR
ncbi:hypothetical protein CLAFUW4_13163 [Fulvia fulva]|uniref:uncharacterized protein n=1 Tax=Passalora fulva TaxID=5499 RepID=UPI002852C9CB|nr:uncharacterized protein CLAFUR5_20346 [Fulvia fulva]KAK4612075.1 hypothetical protein CLAFUR4_13168 [Fulvia fulva]WMI39050.1 hypothetical protein CLAFUR5_20346 [Fulvia fulva]WPV20876.1 hypothetical protein CLAFUW4_13163 [Fulvia fulva]WPV36100.1 hypothetical protein CLAFUW7_13171 [Fulvia fulva]